MYAGCFDFALIMVAEILIMRFKPDWWFEKIPRTILKKVRARSNRFESSWISDWMDDGALNGEKFAYYWTPMASIMFTGFVAFGLFAFRKSLNLWNPAFLPWFTNSTIMFFSTVTALCMGMFGALFIITSKLSSEKRADRAKGIVVLGFLSLIIYIFSVGIYSFMIYPQLPQGLGGGLPAHITVWMERADLPNTLEKRIPSATCQESNGIVECEDLYLVHADSEIVILTDNPKLPAVSFIIPRDSVKNISGSQ